MSKQKKRPGNAEMEVLKALWEHGPANVRMIDRQLRRRGRKWAATTIHTLLSRLKRKGLVSASKRDGVLCFQAKIQKDELVAHQVRELANDLGGGISVPIVRTLVERCRLSDAELAELRQIIDQSADSA